ncbi:hypothetical protein ACTWP5_02560 [Streptomyces sp. 4N509B]|uniref:hypothetical protein n=1 Tax=Streptomyces sp. 4N509B TaxID=3457413 RepID=UPI003FD56F9F
MPVSLSQRDGVDLYRPESRFPLEQETVTIAPEVRECDGPAPFAFRYLTPVTTSGGVLPEVVEYDEETQTSSYDDLPPGVFMTKNPPMTYFTTEATESSPERTDAKDDPGPSDD